MRTVLARTAALVTWLLVIAGTASPTLDDLEAGIPIGPPIDHAEGMLRWADDWAPGAMQRLEPTSFGLERDELCVIVDAVAVSARDFELDPDMILAVIQVESRFDAQAVSVAGALGLMQLRPGTAREVADRLGWEWFDEFMLFDPEVNVRIGSWYLKHLLDRFQDSDAALAAFNAGPGRIAHRHRLTGSVPLSYPDRVWDALLDFRAVTRPDLGAGRIS